MNTSPKLIGVIKIPMPLGPTLGLDGELSLKIYGEPGKPPTQELIIQQLEKCLQDLYSKPIEYISSGQLACIRTAIAADLSRRKDSIGKGDRVDKAITGISDTLESHLRKAGFLSDPANGKTKNGEDIEDKKKKETNEAKQAPWKLRRDYTNEEVKQFVLNAFHAGGADVMFHVSGERVECRCDSCAKTAEVYFDEHRKP